MTSSLRDVTKRVCVVALLWRLVDAVYTSLNKVGGKRCCGAGSPLNVNKLSRGETICPPPPIAADLRPCADESAVQLWWSGLGAARLAGLGADRRTDRQTDGSRHRLMPPCGGGIKTGKGFQLEGLLLYKIKPSLNLCV